MGLAAAFNAQLRSATASKKKQTGLFGVSELTRPDGFAELNQKSREECMVLMKEALSPNRQRKMVQIIDDISNSICCSADLAECVRMLHPDAEMAAGASASMMDFTELVESLNTCYPLYAALRDAACGEDVQKTDAVDDRVAALLLIDFQASGVHLPDKQKSRFVELCQEIFQTGAEFVQAADDPVLVESSELPAHIATYLTSIRPMSRDIASISLNHCLGDSPLPFVREWGYRTYFGENEEQEQRLGRLMRARRQLANLVGLDSYADRAQQFHLLSSAKEAEEFLDGVIQVVRPVALREIEMAQQFFQKNDPDAGPLQVHDISVVLSELRQRNFGLDKRSADEYLSPGTLMEGLSELLQTLYGVRLEWQSTDEGEVWHPSVLKMAVIGENGGLLGYIYCDLYGRADKTGGDCHFTVRCTKEMGDGSVQTPMVVLCMSFPSPSKDSSPTFLNPGQAENLFHEMGHAVHSMLARTRYQHVSGTRCGTDLAETPSNLMERFFYDSRVLQRVGKRYPSGERMSAELARELEGAGMYLGGHDLLQQAFYSLFDLRLHSPDFQSERQTSTELFAALENRVMILPHTPGTAWHHRFSHLVSYGSKYYCYLVAKASAALVWDKVFRKDPFSREKGQLWAEVQGFGGEKPTGELLERILGYKVEAGHLVEAIHNLVKHREKIAN